MTERRTTIPGAADMLLVASASGPASGMPVLLAHGGGQTRRAWRKVAARLAGSGFRAISVDLRGHGESPWSPEGSYDISDFAADLVAAARSLDRRPALIGASLGGLAGLIGEGNLAPGTFASLTLVDITPQMEVDGVARVLGFMSQNAKVGFGSPGNAASAIAAYLPHRERRNSSKGLESYLRKAADGRFYWHWDPAFVENVTRRRSLPGALPTASTELAEAACSLSLPVHLVRGGASDLVSSKGAADFLSLVPHAQFTDIAGASHMVAGDNNDAFGDAILRFLTEIHCQMSPESEPR
ncbi:alpha/beta fold hydrolase [Qipengyuania sediminis]|uniref:alpha/beta fold hydrolase n=1 Tax=Qipengyuania sediminis TaxID=1532023 RepID=UPI00105A8B79|nr:alpha/beta hydrolase [Qipengyuania sediminis]